MTDKVIYLKSLFSKFKPKNKLPEDIRNAMLALGVQVDKEKAAERKSSNGLDEFTSGRKFILKNMDEILSYAIDYSVIDTMKDKFPLNNLGKKSDY